MIKNLIGTLTDVVEIAKAPVEVVVDMTRAGTKPLAENVKKVKDDIKEGLESRE